MRRAFILLLSLWSSAALLSACARESSSHTIASPIVGGVPVPPGHPGATSAVALTKDDQSLQSSFCSGTLIADGLVLTAAHCLDQSDQLHFIGFAVGSSVEFRRVTSMQANPAYRAHSGQPGAFDVAWVKFAGDAPAGYHPIEILDDPAALPPGSVVSMVGFGLTAENGRLPGTMLTTDGKAGSIAVRPFAGGAMTLDLVVGHAICRGDSGGPTYATVDGKPYVVAVTSGIGRPCEQQTSSIHVFAGGFKRWLAASSGVALAGAPGPAFFPVEFGTNEGPFRTCEELLQASGLSERAWWTGRLITGQSSTCAEFDQSSGALVLDLTSFPGHESSLALLPIEPAYSSVEIDALEYTLAFGPALAQTIARTPGVTSLILAPSPAVQNPIDVAVLPPLFASGSPLHDLQLYGPLTACPAFGRLQSLDSLTLEWHDTLSFAELAQLRELQMLGVALFNPTVDQRALATLANLAQPIAFYWSDAGGALSNLGIAALAEAKIASASLAVSSFAGLDLSPLGANPYLKVLSLAGSGAATVPCPSPRISCQLGK
jgi:hypothetical protein